MGSSFHYYGHSLRSSSRGFSPTANNVEAKLNTYNSLKSHCCHRYQALFSRRQKQLNYFND